MPAIITLGCKARMPKTKPYLLSLSHTTLPLSHPPINVIHPHFSLSPVVPASTRFLSFCAQPSSLSYTFPFNIFRCVFIQIS